MTDSAQYL